MNREPIITIASLTAGVTAIIGLLVAFGIDVSKDQQVAILAVVAVVAPFVVPLFGRSKVTPVSDPVAADGTQLVSNGLRAK